MGKLAYTIVLAVVSTMIFSTENLQANDGKAFTARQTPSVYLSVVKGKIRLKGHAPTILRPGQSGSGARVNQLKMKAASLKAQVARLEMQKRFAKESAQELMTKVAWISEEEAIRVVVGDADIDQIFAAHLKESGNVAVSGALAEN